MAMSGSGRIWAAALLAVSALRRSGKPQDCYSAFDGSPLLRFTPGLADELMKFVNTMEELECTEAGSLRSREVMVVCPLEVSIGVMKSYGKNVTVLAADAGAFYRESSGAAQGFVETARSSVGVSTEFYTAWRTFDARTARVAELVQNSGGVATLSQIGTSVEGRPIMVVRRR